MYRRMAMPMIISRPLYASSLLVLVALGHVTGAASQQLEAEPEAALACFEESIRAGKHGSDMSLCPPGVIAAEAIVLRPIEYPAATLTAVLDGLERLALTSDDRRVQLAAAIWAG
jgi:hypothetical protein